MVVVAVVVAVVARLDLTMIVDEGVTGVAAAAEATTALMTMPCAVSGTRAVMAPFVRFDLFPEVDQVMPYEGGGREKDGKTKQRERGERTSGCTWESIGSASIVFSSFILCLLMALNPLESWILSKSICHDIKWWPGVWPVEGLDIGLGEQAVYYSLGDFL